MSAVIYTIIATIFILAAMRQILYWSWLWQLKEYRLDRMRAHFQDIGKKNSFLTILGYSSLRQRKIPKITLKILLIIFAAVLFSTTVLLKASTLWLYDSEKVIQYFFASFLIIPIIVLLLVAVLSFFGDIFKKRIITEAKKKIGRFPNLTVVGITGSYGKSTTKEILADILEKRFEILKTPENINTPIGIARLILNKLTARHQIFIVEMAAYKKGEIKEICDMAHPKIGILTAINEQHLAMFGKIENTIAAKFELIEALPKDGLAILNIGDKNIQKGLENILVMAQKKLYSAEAKADIYAIDIDISSSRLKFRVIEGAQIQDFKTNLIGRHNVSNVLAATTTAMHFGIGLKEISEILRKANQFPHAFFPCAGTNGSVFINDTYNANPDGVTAAIDYLKDRSGRKIIVMSSLIELGNAAKMIHKKLGKQISKIAQRLILTDDYYINEIKAGANENGSSSMDIKLGYSDKAIAGYLRKNLRPTDTVLFINRGAGKVLNLLKNNSGN